MLKEIKTDVFNISKRIKAIDKNYMIFYNTDEKRYELHHNKQKKDIGISFLLVFPYDTLDERAIEYTLSTRADKIDIKKYIENIDEYNNYLEEKHLSDSMDKLSYESKEILKFVDKSVTREVTADLIREVERGN